MSDVSEEFLALLAHELRTPVAAIIGYHDLMSEGILGDVSPRVGEAVDRMRSSANQLLALIASLGEMGVADISNLHVDIDDEDPREIVETALETLSSEALGRFTNVIVGHLPESGSFSTDRERVQRAILLVLHAAIKNTPSAELYVNADSDDIAFSCIITGANLDTERDSVTTGPFDVKTAAAMRLAMADHAIRPLNGTLTLEMVDGSSRVTIRVPSTPKVD